MNTEEQNPETKQSRAKLKVQHSLQQPTWQVLILCILTSFAYPYYWFYKNWRDLSAQANHPTATPNQSLLVYRNISPLLRTCVMVLPGTSQLLAGSISAMGSAFASPFAILALLTSPFALYLAATQIKVIAELSPDPNCWQRRHPLISTGLLLGATLGLLSLNLLPGALALLSLIAALPLAFAQHWLNCYWKSTENSKLPIRYLFTGAELVVITLGSLLLGLNIAGYMLGVSPESKSLIHY